MKERQKKLCGNIKPVYKYIDWNTKEIKSTLTLKKLREVYFFILFDVISISSLIKIQKGWNETDIENLTFLECEHLRSS